MSFFEEQINEQDDPSMGRLHVAAQKRGFASLLHSLIARVVTSIGNCSLRCSTSCIHAVVCQEAVD